MCVLKMGKKESGLRPKPGTAASQASIFPRRDHGVQVDLVLSVQLIFKKYNRRNCDLPPAFSGLTRP